MHPCFYTLTESAPAQKLRGLIMDFKIGDKVSLDYHSSCMDLQLGNVYTVLDATVKYVLIENDLKNKVWYDYAWVKLAEKESQKFYMVYNPLGNTPRQRHSTKESALTEAERLAKLHKDKTFYVLEAITKIEVEKPKVLKEDL